MDLSDATPLKAGNVFTMVAPNGSLPLGIFMDDVRHLAPFAGRGRWRLDARGFAEAELSEDAPFDADFAPMLAVRGFGELPGPAARDGDSWSRGERSTTLTRTGVGVRLDFAPAPAAPATVDLPSAEGPLGRALDDLRMLCSSLDGLRYFAAGVPWYVTLFGRDSLICAHQALRLAPDVAAETLRLLADRIGRRSDPEREEQPGKIGHEFRPAGEPSPLARYYGSVDATPLWLCLLCEHAELTGDRALFDELRPRVEAMLRWLGDGLLTYAASAPGGLRNQGWKDSADGICHEDGTPLEPPIALVEAQGYAIRARRGLARLYERAGDRAAAARLDAAAAAHALALERFWLPGRGYYAMAIGGDGRPSEALASNQGHLLWAGAVTPDRARAIRDALMSEASFSGWGIRTLAEGVAAYDPLSYHRGSVWPHDTAMIAAGLLAYGFEKDFGRLRDGLLAAAPHFPGGSLPELFGGQREGPMPYPVSCRPQAWAAGALVALSAAA